MSVRHIVSISGGKDSTAMMLLALEYRQSKNIDVNFVFADTGNEHPAVYEYLNYLENRLDITINRHCADFRDAIKHKRWVVDTKWRREGVPEKKIQETLGELYPTGNPFLDLCLVKGRFPSRKAQFCTQELKANVIEQQVILPIRKDGHKVLSWQGVRAEESLKRANDPTFENQGLCYVWRPIKHWKIADVFAMHRKHGIEPNPLYKQGMSRVGCMPCINCKKSELKEISRRFPDHIDRIAEWEGMVSRASKRGKSSFFSNTDKAALKIPNIKKAVEWSKTTRGAWNFDLIDAIADASEVPACSSAYGLCDAGGD